MANGKILEKRSFLLLLALLLALGLYVLWPFLHTLILSVILVVMFYPLHQWIVRKLPKWQGIAASLSVFAVILFIIIPVALIVTLVTTQIFSVVSNLSQNISKPQIADLISHYQDQIAFVIAKVEYHLGVDINLVPTIERGLNGLARMVATYSPAVLAETANIFLHLFIMIIVMFYLFRDGDKFYQAMIRISPVKDQYEHKLAREFKETIYGVFYGSFLTGIIQAILATVGYYLAGVEGPIVWGTITFFVSFIPIIGTAGVIIPLAIVLILQGHWKQAVFLGVYGAAVIGMADNLLRPLLTRSNMHQLVLFLSIFGGLAVFGAIGLLLGPIIMAMLTAVLNIYQRDFSSNSK